MRHFILGPSVGLLLVIGLNFISLPSTFATSQASRNLHQHGARQISAAATAGATSRGPHYQPETTDQTKDVSNTAERSGVESQPNKLLRLAAINSPSQDTNALLYLQRYGYMQAATNAEANNLISEESFSEAISNFQRFAGLPETGTIDNQTLRLMRTPRCGNVDRVGQLGASFLRDDHQQNEAAGPKNVSWPVWSSATLAQNSQAIDKQVKRKKRYALQGSKWRRQELTYRISQYPTRFSGKRQEVDAQIEKAFGIWSQVAPINFVVKKEGRVHIDIRFASGDHGDGDAFDGPGNTLAHAYFPQYGGDAHFDDQEYWTIDSYTGTNIFQVAAHELGHSLGLGHSNVREALMAPFYQKYKPNFKLHVDDILAIQALYGEKAFLPSSSSSSADSPFSPPLSSNDIGVSIEHHHRGHYPAPLPLPTTSTTTTTTPSTTPTTTTPASPTSTTALYPDGPRFMFGLPPIDSSGFNPFRPGPTNRHDPADGRSRPGEHGFDGSNGGADEGDRNPSSALPADLCSESAIDAITRTEDGRSYVFKGDYYWLLTSDGLAKDYPRRISLDWEGLPGSLDAALTWADGKTFFFKGNKYWRFRNKRRDSGYPKPISAGFAGIPNDIDAAFVWSGNGRTYIFKGAEYWRFDSKADPPVSAEYPRSIRVWNGVPYHINAAFRWENNVTYFFKGNQYYRFNDKDFKVESRGKPPFPRSSAEWWFGCVNTNLAQKSLPGNFFREGITEEAGASSNQDTADWSYLAGLEDSTRIMGTHISDRRPGNSEANTHSSKSNTDSEVKVRGTIAPTPRMMDNNHPTTYVPQLFGGGRIGLFHPSRMSRSSSAAITNTSPSNRIQVVSIALLAMLWTFYGVLGSNTALRAYRQMV